MVPAFEIPGLASTCIKTVDVFGLHTPFETRHCRILVPVASAVTVVAARPGFVIVPVPEITDQVAVPNVGVIAARVVLGELIHNV